MIQLYPDQLRRIADLCEALNTADGVATPETEGVTLGLQQGIAVVSEHGDVFGFLSDEIGGFWGFWPGTDNPYEKKEQQ